MSDRAVVDFAGREIDVRWDGRLCIHVAECGQAKGELFVAGRDPWCIPDRASRAEVREICERCPSGALSYTDKVGPPEAPAPENTVQVCVDGPLFVHGELLLDGHPTDMPGISRRLALCRCGHSKHKPFCDNSHREVQFRDYGAVGETGPGVAGSGGPLTIRAIPNGPLFLSGRLTLRAGTGRVAWQGDQVWLCRCGESGNKPFCDGSHQRVGFTA